MVSALVLQLIQCCVALPPRKLSKGVCGLIMLLSVNVAISKHYQGFDSDNESSHSSYEAAVSCAKAFLSSFMKRYCSCSAFLCSYIFSRCVNRATDDDYRPILENFTQDLLAVLNLPEWPAAEMLLRITESVIHQLIY